MNDVDQAVKCVAENETSAIKVIRNVTKDGTKGGQVILRREKIMPERMESPARCHVFHDVAGFTKFIKVNKTKRTIVFADVDNVVIKAVLDDEAKQGFERVSLRPPYHPEFDLLNETLLDQTLTIDIFAQAIMRNRRLIKDTDKQSAQDIALIMQQIVVSSETTQYIGDGKTAVNGLVTTTKITAGGPETKNQLQIPDSFVVEVPIYLNTKAKKFGVDITISTKSGMGVCAVVDCPELKVKKYEVFEEMMTGIKKLEGVTVVYGHPSTVDWAYNK